MFVPPSFSDLLNKAVHHVRPPRVARAHPLAPVADL